MTVDVLPPAIRRAGDHCHCEAPRELTDPRRRGVCRECSGLIEGVGISNDESFAEYFDRLEEGIFPWIQDAEERAKQRGFFWRFRNLCSFREHEGREKFGLDYLFHDFWKNMSEEVADVCVYAYLRALRTRRETGEDDNIEVLLQGSKMVIEGLGKLMEYKPKRAGSP